MQYQQLYDAIAARDASEKRVERELIAAGRKLIQPDEAEERQYHIGVYLVASSRFDELFEISPEKAAYAAVLMVIEAAELGMLEEALEQIEKRYPSYSQKTFNGEKFLQAAIALLAFNAKHPTNTDDRREQAIVWQALTS